MSETAVMSPTQIVMDVIQRVYGDATQTVLDQRCASEVIAALRQAGWCSVDELGAVIMAAGGKVEVTDRELRDIGTNAVTVFVSENYRTMGRTLTASRKEPTP